MKLCSITTRLLAIGCAFAVVASIELALHWYMGAQQTSAAQMLREIYLYSEKKGQFYRVLLDILGPASVLGVCTGVFGARWRPWAVVCSAAFAAVGIAAASRAYPAYFPREPRAARPTNANEIYFAAEACLVCGWFAFAAQSVLQRPQKKRAADGAPLNSGGPSRARTLFSFTRRWTKTYTWVVIRTVKTSHTADSSETIKTLTAPERE